MIRLDLDRLRDAREFARHAQNNAGGLSAATLAEAIQPQHAALYDIAIIGETLNRISTEIKGVAPRIEWRLIAALRNIIIHSYWQIDLGIIANIVEHRLDPLIVELDKLIDFVEQSGK
jgi:uncharacterized protein with HEPN domain